METLSKSSEVFTKLGCLSTIISFAGLCKETHQFLALSCREINNFYLEWLPKLEKKNMSSLTLEESCLYSQASINHDQRFAWEVKILLIERLEEETVEILLKTCFWKHYILDLTFWNASTIQNMIEIISRSEEFNSNNIHQIRVRWQNNEEFQQAWGEFCDELALREIDYRKLKIHYFQDQMYKEDAKNPGKGKYLLMLTKAAHFKKMKTKTLHHIDSMTLTKWNQIKSLLDDCNWRVNQLHLSASNLLNFAQIGGLKKSCLDYINTLFFSIDLPYSDTDLGILASFTALFKGEKKINVCVEQAEENIEAVFHHFGENCTITLPGKEHCIIENCEIYYKRNSIFYRYTAEKLHLSIHSDCFCKNTVESPDFISLSYSCDFVPSGSDKGKIETLQTPDQDVLEYFSNSIRQTNFIALRNKNLSTHLIMRRGSCKCHFGYLNITKVGSLYITHNQWTNEDLEVLSLPKLNRKTILCLSVHNRMNFSQILNSSYFLKFSRIQIEMALKRLGVDLKFFGAKLESLYNEKKMKEIIFKIYIHPNLHYTIVLQRRYKEFWREFIDNLATCESPKALKELLQRYYKTYNPLCVFQIPKFS
ncbi:unnamed protein product [Moneuplotes crassus]|uniref:Uncharacterized protein n=1 Tax=Euplotes crassus TaxID=5936 RepID=A0AAD1U640_EUPCR|nr:unnamed protein product [Moneuplotes crassus]